MKRHRLELRIQPDSHDHEWWEAFCALTEGANDSILNAWAETERDILDGVPADIGDVD